MSNEESKLDAVKEARALLAKTAPKGKITNGADAYLFDMRGPAILSILCDEVEELRRRNETQADSIMEFQAEQKAFRAVNSHEALVEALRPFANTPTHHFEQGHAGVASDCPVCGPILRAMNALALAEKES